MNKTQRSHKPLTVFMVTCLFFIVSSGAFFAPQTTANAVEQTDLIEDDVDENAPQKEGDQPADLPQKTGKGPETREEKARKRSDPRYPVGNVNDTPFKETIRIDITYPNGTTTWCSSTIIEGNFLLTNSHCTYNPNHGGAATQVWARAGLKDGQATLGRQPAQGTIRLQEGKNLFINSSYKGDVGFANDYSLIYLGNDRTLINRTGVMKLSEQKPNVNDSIRSTGFPNYINYNNTPIWGNTMITGTGNVIDPKEPSGTLWTTSVISPGNSGGPFTNSRNEQIGLVSYYWILDNGTWTSGGPPIEKPLLQQLSSWKSQASYRNHESEGKDAITAKYNQNKSQLGAAESSIKCGLKDNGCYQKYRNGHIYWTSKTGAHITKGGIHKKWASEGWERGARGYPITDERCGLKSNGCVQRFQNGAIYWTSATKAQSISGGILGRYKSQGYENGVRGYPVTSEICGLKEGGCYQRFQNGTIYWTSATKAQSISGAIQQEWARMGYERGKAGYPTTSAQCIGSPFSSCVQSFQRGKIMWKRNVGARYTE